jgi:hypothetical protein
VRGWLPGLILIAACYAPTIPAGAPCVTTSECPGEQQCIVGHCTRIAASPGPDGGGGGTDAGRDGPPGTLDRDGDGVLDTADNCPDKSNADQANEDGDRFGDVCDPCPFDRNDNPSDPDGDGVADACDPNPTVAGDHIELFEGFHHGLPSWTRTGTWTAVGDSVRLTTNATSDGYLIPTLPRPLPNPSRVAVFASVAIESVAGTNSTTDHGVGVSAPFEAATDSGIECALYQPSNVVGDRYVSLGDDFSQKEIAFTSLSWTNQTAYTIGVVRRGTAYTCGAVEPNGTAHTATGTSTTSTASPQLSVRAYAATATVSWVLVVSSP